MIRNESIILAEGVALNLASTLELSPALHGLMEVSLGGAAYGDNYRQQIVDVTTENESHTQVMEDASTRLAEIIRATFGQIRDFGAPFSRELVSALENKWLPISIQEMGFQGLDAEFVCVEHPFFSSLVYPTHVKNTALSFSSVNLEVLSRLSFRKPEREEILSWLNTTHPDVVNIMESPEQCPSYAFEHMTDLAALADLFEVPGKNQIDFTQVKTLDLPRLFQMYVMLSKMEASADPVKWLTSGSLADYREFVALMWNGLTAHLLRVKQLCEAYRQRGIAVMETKPVKLETKTWDDSMARYTYLALSGRVKVLYTSSAIDQLTQQDSSLRDWVVARYYGRLKYGNASVTDMGLLGGVELRKLCGEYYRQIGDTLERNREMVFEQVYHHTVDKFLANTPALVEFLKARDPDTNPTAQVIATMNKEFKWGHRISLYARDFTKLDVAVANSGVATAFLRAIGCDLAAAILQGTEVQSCEEDTALDKRKRLHYAVINQLVRILLSGK